MPDFTFRTFRLLLDTLKAQHYTFQTFVQFLGDPASRAIILRHDVDARKLNSLHVAQLESELGITGTFNFRILPRSFDTEVIRKISAYGHEIGYHYEDLAIAAKASKGRGTRDEGRGRMGKGHGNCNEGLYEMALKLFEQNLAKIRQVAPVETICMHGSPLSKYDNRKLWEKYNYRDFGIIGEPYFDIDFSKVLYLTDTGRRWDGERVSVRDKMGEGSSKMEDSRRDKGQGTRDRGRGTRDKGQGTISINVFRSTFDIIKAANKGQLPDQIMINVHPQRWDDRPLPWIREFIFQNIKNWGKRILILKEDSGKKF